MKAMLLAFGVKKPYFPLLLSIQTCLTLELELKGEEESEGVRGFSVACELLPKKR